MLQNIRVTAFTVSELLRENQQGVGGGGKITPTHPPPPRLGLKTFAYTGESKCNLSRAKSKLFYRISSCMYRGVFRTLSKSKEERL